MVLVTVDRSGVFVRLSRQFINRTTAMRMASAPSTPAA
jgi:hypothetical protein